MSRILSLRLIHAMHALTSNKLKAVAVPNIVTHDCKRSVHLFCARKKEQWQSPTARGWQLGYQSLSRKTGLLQHGRQAGQTFVTAG